MRLKQFLFPPLNKRLIIRLFLVTISSYLVFEYIFTPFIIRGSSMEPTYRNGAINFCFKLRYLFSKPERFDIVAIQLSKKRWLLKRVVAVEEEEVEFREGKLFVNGRLLVEPYVKFPCNWNLSPRRIEKGYIYVVGDNRSMPVEEQVFGQTKIDRIIGSPLW